MAEALSNPKVSIVIVVKNAASTIKNAIKSVLEQDYINYELVILDGASTDGTLDIIDAYKNRIAFFSSAPDFGIYDAMNKAVKRCTGDRIYFLGSDDELFDTSVLSRIFSEPHQADEVVYGNAYYLHRQKARFGKMNKYKLSKHNFNHQTIFYPSSVFEDYTFQINYKILADYYINLQLYFKSSYKFKYLDIVVARFNDKGASGMQIDPIFEEDIIQLRKEMFPFEVYLFYKLRNIFLNIQKLFN